MILHGLLGEVEFEGDLLVRPAASDERQQLAFAAGKAKGIRRPGPPAGLVSDGNRAEQDRQQLPGAGHLSPRYRFQGGKQFFRRCIVEDVAGNAARDRSEKYLRGGRHADQNQAEARADVAEWFDLVHDPFRSGNAGEEQENDGVTRFRDFCQKGILDGGLDAEQSECGVGGDEFAEEVAQQAIFGHDENAAFPGGARRGRGGARRSEVRMIA